MVNFFSYLIIIMELFYIFNLSFRDIFRIHRLYINWLFLNIYNTNCSYLVVCTRPYLYFIELFEINNTTIFSILNT